MAIKSQIEAIIYAAEEPVTLEQITTVLKDAVLAEGGLAEGLEQKALDAEVKQRVKAAIEDLVKEYESGERGMEIRQVAGGWRMGTKPEHHDVVRHFAKSLKPPVRLSLPALETLAVIAYKQPATGPEIMEIRGVQGGGVLKTLLDRKLIAVAGRKNVIGKPMLYKTTKEFLIQFGLKDLSELPSLKEFEEIRRMAFSDSEPPQREAAGAAAEPVTEPVAEPILEAPAEEEGAEEAVAETSEATPEVEAESAPAPAAESAPNEEN